MSDDGTKFGGLFIPKDDGGDEPKRGLKHKHKGNRTVDKKARTKHHKKLMKHKHRHSKKIAKAVRRGLSA